MRRRVGALLAAVIAVVLALLAIPSPEALAVEPTVSLSTYAYDGQHSLADVASDAVERGPTSASARKITPDIQQTVAISTRVRVAAKTAETAGAGAARTAARACSTNSFTSSTPVLMADGSKKPIADVKVGDRVVAADPQTGQSGPRAVQLTGSVTPVRTRWSRSDLLTGRRPMPRRGGVARIGEAELARLKAARSASVRVPEGR